MLDSLRPFANGFDARYYGGAPATESDYEEALRRYEQVLGAAGVTTNRAA